MSAQDKHQLDQIILGDEVLEAGDITGLIAELSAYQPSDAIGGGLSAQQRIEITGIVTEAFQQ